jgi:hypothetical protein
MDTACLTPIYLIMKPSVVARETNTFQKMGVAHSEVERSQDADVFVPAVWGEKNSSLALPLIP